MAARHKNRDFTVRYHIFKGRSISRTAFVPKSVRQPPKRIAFDSDLNSDGAIDAATERFYFALSNDVDPPDGIADATPCNLERGSWDILLFNNGVAEEDQVPIKVGGEDCKPDPCRTLNDIIDQIEPGGRMVGPATFTLTIQDNDDLDGNGAVDSDDTVLLTSSLAAPYRNATATISTSVRGGGEPYAQEHYNAGSTGEAAMESEVASAHVRW